MKTLFMIWAIMFRGVSVLRVHYAPCDGGTVWRAYQRIGADEMLLRGTPQEAVWALRRSLLRRANYFWPHVMLSATGTLFAVQLALSAFGVEPYNALIVPVGLAASFVWGAAAALYNAWLRDE